MTECNEAFDVSSLPKAQEPTPHCRQKLPHPSFVIPCIHPLTLLRLKHRINHGGKATSTEEYEINHRHPSLISEQDDTNLRFEYTSHKEARLGSLVKFSSLSPERDQQSEALSNNS